MMTEAELGVYLTTAGGYDMVRKLPDGKFIGVTRMITTTGLFVGLTEDMYERRYCFEHYGDAATAFAEWNGVGDPPGPWIKEKPSNRLGPGATA